MRRWLVERFFAWIQWQRRILVRWQYHAQNFLGFVQLACLVGIGGFGELRFDDLAHRQADRPPPRPTSTPTASAPALRFLGPPNPRGLS